MTALFPQEAFRLFEMRWFGESWHADICFSQPHAETPVGEPCCHCEEKIEDGDQGYIYANGPAAHRNCFIRQISGSLAHILKRCGCFVPGSQEHDPPGLTKRQAANLAAEVNRRANEIPDLYEIAKRTCHEFGMPWTDPRTGETFEPPTKEKGPRRSKTP